MIGLMGGGLSSGCRRFLRNVDVDRSMGWFDRSANCVAGEEHRRLGIGMCMYGFGTDLGLL